MVCTLHKALYGLKIYPRAWYERLHNYLIKIGFEKTNDNRNLYLKIEKCKGIMLKSLLMILFLEEKMLYAKAFHKK